LPPFATAARYEAPGKSDAYATRNPARTARELALLARVWPGRPDESVLDLPCGAGRLLPFLHERGHRVVQADGAFAMLRQARARGERPVPAAQADALATPFADGAFDGVVMFRFLHHLSPAVRRQAIAEACRTARRFVVTSFFHPCSVHHLQRCLRRLGGAAPTRFVVTKHTLAAEFAAHGFRLATTAAELPYARDLWVVSFVRAGAGAGERRDDALRTRP
jgi:SAM-dependent methyltransferase